jgi:alpha-beta hydrolase superfamily lysophospholipase
MSWRGLPIRWTLKIEALNIEARLKISPSTKQSARPRRIGLNALRAHHTRTIDPNAMNAKRRRIEPGATTRQIMDAMLRSPTHLGWIKQQQVCWKTDRDPATIAKSQRRCTVTGQPTNRIG